MTVQEYPAIYCGDELNKNQHSPLGVKLHIIKMWRECYIILSKVFVRSQSINEKET